MHLGPLCMQLRVPVCFSSLWEGQKLGFFPKDRTYRAFLHRNLFILIAPRDLHYYWASAQPCVVNNTFFSLWECPKMGFFSYGSHISRLLCAFAQKEFFSDGPGGIECILDLCACS